MALALHPEYRSLLERLIVVDISPAKGPISGDFAQYLKAMREIRKQLDAGQIKTKKDANALLVDVEKDTMTRQFLLTNLVPTESKDLGWRISLDNLEEGLKDIGDFPYEPGETTFDKPTLFIKGETSKYINRKNLEVCKQFFPNMQLKTVPGVGHWGAFRF
jgi:pimeloyl-ACP methyl ester carboxylesterase